MQKKKLTKSIIMRDYFLSENETKNILGPIVLIILAMIFSCCLIFDMFNNFKHFLKSVVPVVIVFGGLGCGVWYYLRRLWSLWYETYKWRVIVYEDTVKDKYIQSLLHMGHRVSCNLVLLDKIKKHDPRHPDYLNISWLSYHRAAINGDCYVVELKAREPKNQTAPTSEESQRRIFGGQAVIVSQKSHKPFPERRLGDNFLIYQKDKYELDEELQRMIIDPNTGEGEEDFGGTD